MHFKSKLETEGAYEQVPVRSCGMRAWVTMGLAQLKVAAATPREGGIAPSARATRRGIDGAPLQTAQDSPCAPLAQRDFAPAAHRHHSSQRHWELFFAQSSPQDRSRRALAKGPSGDGRRKGSLAHTNLSGSHGQKVRSTYALPLDQGRVAFGGIRTRHMPL